MRWNETYKKYVSTNKQTNNNMENTKQLLGIMSAIIYSQMPEVTKDNGYGIINAVGQARELLKEIDRQTSFKAQIFVSSLLYKKLNTKYPIRCLEEYDQQRTMQDFQDVEDASFLPHVIGNQPYRQVLGVKHKAQNGLCD